MLSSLRHRPFAFLWAGQAISRLGDALYQIALAWWLVEKTGSATIMATVLIFSNIPMLIFILIGGVAADRFPRVQVMLASDVLRLAVVGVVAALTYTNTLQVWHIFVASAIFGTVGAFFLPAYTAIIPEITPLEIRNSANALTSISYKFSFVIGPALGAIVYSLTGASAAFALDAASFLVAALCVLPLLGLRQPAPAEPARPNVLAEVRDGVATVAGIPWLWVTIILFGFLNMTFNGPLRASIPFLIKDNLHGTVGLLAEFTTAQALGNILGAALIGRLRRFGHRGLIGYGSQAVCGLLLALMGLGIPALAVIADSFVLGIFFAFFDLIWTATLQELVPPEKLGRVSSVDALGSFVLLPVGYGLTGILTDRLGAPAVLAGGGLLSVLCIGVALLHPAVRRVD